MHVYFIQENNQIKTRIINRLYLYVLRLMTFMTFKGHIVLLSVTFHGPIIVIQIH